MISIDYPLQLMKKWNKMLRVDFFPGDLLVKLLNNYSDAVRGNFCAGLQAYRPI